jgi:hypothetical protein
MVVSESMRLEKLFQEDQARGGSGVCARGGVDCAGSAMVVNRAVLKVAIEILRVNVFEKS